MSATAAWAVIVIGFVLPLIHVAVTPGLSASPSLPSENGQPSTCPFSPRIGWIVIVLFLGPIGWLMFMGSRRRKQGSLPSGNSGSGGSSAQGAGQADPKIDKG